MTTLLRLAKLVLTLKCFSFSGNFFKQALGSHRGIARMRPSYDDLFHVRELQKRLEFFPPSTNTILVQQEVVLRS